MEHRRHLTKMKLNLKIMLFPPDDLLTSGRGKRDVEFESHLLCLEIEDHGLALIKAEEFNTMISEEDDSPALNGRLRPRKSTAATRKPSGTISSSLKKVATDKPKKYGSSSKASPNTQDDLTAKADTSSIAQFLCPLCDKKFTNKVSFKRHTNRLHQVFINCIYCDYRDASSDEEVMRHMLDNHPNQYFACLVCETRFNSTSEMAEHKLTTCEKPIPACVRRLRKQCPVPETNLETIKANENIPVENNEPTPKPEYSALVISCEPSLAHDAVDIEDKITTNLILPSNINNPGMEQNTVLILDDIQWNKRMPPNFSFRNADADQILSRLGVVHRSPRVGESSRKEWLKLMDDSNHKFEKCFDTSFYSRVASNVQENLAKFLDGSHNFSPDPDKIIKTRKSKSSAIINTAEGFPILLPYEQYCRNRYDGYIPRAIAPKHKWKWDSSENEKNMVLDANVIKRDNHVDNCIITLVSNLDIWTQLRMRHKFEGVFCKVSTEKSGKQNTVGNQLKEILESREIPSPSRAVEQPSSSTTTSVAVTDTVYFPNALGLSARASGGQVVGPAPAVLSGEWVRPRCYVCCACGEQSHEARALSAHVTAHHPNAQVQHYEIVGESLLNADILKHLYVPPSLMSNRTRPLRGFRDCTKCKKSITMEDMHQHMLDCAGDTPTVRRKCRSRLFGVRKRRPRLAENPTRKKLRKNLRSRQTQKKLLRARPRIRTEVGDAETIRKMIADLPAKRHRTANETLVTPQVLRPRRKLETIHRNKLKRLSSLERPTRKLGLNTELIDQPLIDEDDQPLKPKTKTEPEQLVHTKIRFSTRVVASRNKKESTAAKELSTSDEKVQDPPSGSASQPNRMSSENTSQRLNINAKGNDNGERENRNSSDKNDGDQRDKLPDENRDNHKDGVPDAPLLKHSINNITALTANTELQLRKSPLQLKTLETPSDTRQVFLENEIGSSVLDKPPLQKNPKKTSVKKRLSLLNCIEKIKSQQKGEMLPRPEMMRNYQCDNEQPNLSLLDPHPAVICRTRDESGAANNVIPDNIDYQCYPAPRRMEMAPQSIPIETIMFNQPAPFYTSINPNLGLTPPTTKPGRRRRKSSAKQSSPARSEYEQAAQFHFSQNLQQRPWIQTVPLIQSGLLPAPIAPQRLPYSDNLLMQQLRACEAIKCGYPMQYRNMGFPLPLTYPPAVLNYDGRRDHAFQRVEPGAYPAAPPISPQTWARESAHTQPFNNEHAAAVSFPPKSSNNLSIQKRRQSAKRSSESSDTDYSSVQSLSESMELHNSSVNLFTQPKSTFGRSAYFNNKRAMTPNEMVFNKTPDYKNYSENPNSNGEAHAKEGASYRITQSQTTAAIDPVPKSLYSNKKVFHERYLADHPHLSPSVPTESQAAKITTSADDSTIFESYETYTPVQNEDNSIKSVQLNHSTKLDLINQDPYIEVGQERDESEILLDEPKSNLCEQPLDLSGKSAIAHSAKSNDYDDIERDANASKQSCEDLPTDLSLKDNSLYVESMALVFERDACESEQSCENVPTDCFLKDNSLNVKTTALEFERDDFASKQSCEDVPADCSLKDNSLDVKSMALEFERDDRTSKQSCEDVPADSSLKGNSSNLKCMALESERDPCVSNQSCEDVPTDCSPKDNSLDVKSMALEFERDACASKPGCEDVPADCSLKDNSLDVKSMALEFERDDRTSKQSCEDVPTDCSLKDNSLDVKSMALESERDACVSNQCCEDVPTDCSPKDNSLDVKSMALEFERDACASKPGCEDVPADSSLKDNSLDVKSMALESERDACVSNQCCEDVPTDCSPKDNSLDVKSMALEFERDACASKPGCEDVPADSSLKDNSLDVKSMALESERDACVSNQSCEDVPTDCSPKDNSLDVKSMALESERDACVSNQCCEDVPTDCSPKDNSLEVKSMALEFERDAFAGKQSCEDVPADCSLKDNSLDVKNMALEFERNACSSKQSCEDVPVDCSLKDNSLDAKSMALDVQYAENPRIIEHNNASTSSQATCNAQLLCNVNETIHVAHPEQMPCIEDIVTENSQEKACVPNEENIETVDTSIVTESNLDEDIATHSSADIDIEIEIIKAREHLRILELLREGNKNGDKEQITNLSQDVTENSESDKNLPTTILPDSALELNKENATTDGENTANLNNMEERYNQQVGETSSSVSLEIKQGAGVSVFPENLEPQKAKESLVDELTPPLCDASSNTYESKLTVSTASLPISSILPKKRHSPSARINSQEAQTKIIFNQASTSTLSAKSDIHESELSKKKTEDDLKDLTTKQTIENSSELSILNITPMPLTNTKQFNKKTSSLRAVRIKSAKKFGKHNISQLIHVQNTNSHGTYEVKLGQSLEVIKSIDDTNLQSITTKETCDIETSKKINHGTDSLTAQLPSVEHVFATVHTITKENSKEIETENYIQPNIDNYNACMETCKQKSNDAHNNDTGEFANISNPLMDSLFQDHLHSESSSLSLKGKKYKVLSTEPIAHQSKILIDSIDSCRMANPLENENAESISKAKILTKQKLDSLEVSDDDDVCLASMVKHPTTTQAAKQTKQTSLSATIHKQQTEKIFKYINSKNNDTAQGSLEIKTVKVENKIEITKEQINKKVPDHGGRDSDNTEEINSDNKGDSKDVYKDALAKSLEQSRHSHIEESDDVGAILNIEDSTVNDAVSLQECNSNVTINENSGYPVQIFNDQVAYENNTLKINAATLVTGNNSNIEELDSFSAQIVPFTKKQLIFSKLLHEENKQEETKQNIVLNTTDGEDDDNVKIEFIRGTKISTKRKKSSRKSKNRKRKSNEAIEKDELSKIDTKHANTSSKRQRKSSLLVNQFENNVSNAKTTKLRNRHDVALYDFPANKDMHGADTDKIELVIDESKEIQNKPEKINTATETRTACYNRPFNKLTNFASIHVKNPANYDPYDIDLEIDMAETKRPVVKRKKNRTVSRNKKTKTSKKKLHHVDLVQKLGQDSPKAALVVSAPLNDSDSSISDTPLQKYYEKKEKLKIEALKSPNSQKLEKEPSLSALVNTTYDDNMVLSELTSTEKPNCNNNNDRTIPIYYEKKEKLKIEALKSPNSQKLVKEPSLSALVNTTDDDNMVLSELSSTEKPNCNNNNDSTIPKMNLVIEYDTNISTNSIDNSKKTNEAEIMASVRDFIAEQKNTSRDDQDNDQNNTDSETFSEKSNTKQKKTLRSQAAGKNETLNYEKSDLQLSSDKYMENFGFFSIRQPRNANILATKKISETYNMIENDDADFRPRERQRKHSHNESKKVLAYGAHSSRTTQEINNAFDKRISAAPSTSLSITETTVYEPNPTANDGEVDLVTAQKMLESEEIRKLERDLYFGFKEAAEANANKTSGFNYLRAEETCIQNVNQNVIDPFDANADIKHVESREPASPDKDESEQGPKSPEMPESPESPEGILIDKPLMYPEEEVNIYEDKYDIIKRRREASANAKQLLKVDKPKKSNNEIRKKKPDKKTKRRTKKPVYQVSQVLTKGALKGFEAIKISIATQDLNMPPSVSPSYRYGKNQKQKESTGKARSLSASSHKSDADPIAAVDAQHDVYEFQDDERPVPKGYRLSRTMSTSRDKSRSSSTEYEEKKRKCDQHAKEKLTLPYGEGTHSKKLDEPKSSDKKRYKGKGKGKRTRTKEDALGDGLQLDEVKIMRKKKSKNYKGRDKNKVAEPENDRKADLTLAKDDVLSNDNAPVFDNDEPFYDSDIEMPSVTGTSGFVPDRNDESSYDSDSSSPPLSLVLKGPYACTCLSEIDSDDSETERGCAHKSCRYNHLNAAKNAVMGKIFKNNAVRCEKIDEKPESPKPDLDRLFDSLLEPTNNVPSTSTLVPIAGPSSANLFYYTTTPVKKSLQEKELSHLDDGCNSRYSAKDTERHFMSSSLYETDNSKADDAFNMFNFSENTEETTDNGRYVMVSEKPVQTEDPEQLARPEIAQDGPEDVEPESSDFIVLKRKNNAQKSRGTQTKRFSKSDVGTSHDGKANAAKIAKKHRKTNKKHKSHHKRNKTYENEEKHKQSGSKTTSEKPRSSKTKHAIKATKRETNSRGRQPSPKPSTSRTLDEGTSQDGVKASGSPRQRVSQKGVAEGRARRKCTVGKQNVLAEHWSSSESDAGHSRVKGRKSSVVKESARGQKGQVCNRSQGEVEERPRAHVSKLRVPSVSPPNNRARLRGLQESHGWIGAADSGKKLVSMLVYNKMLQQRRLKRLKPQHPRRRRKRRREHGSEEACPDTDDDDDDPDDDNDDDHNSDDDDE